MKKKNDIGNGEGKVSAALSQYLRLVEWAGGKGTWLDEEIKRKFGRAVTFEEYIAAQYKTFADSDIRILEFEHSSDIEDEGQSKEAINKALYSLKIQIEEERMKAIMQPHFAVECEYKVKLLEIVYQKIEALHLLSPQATKIQESKSSTQTQRQNALYIFYLQKAGELKWFENMECGKVKAIRSICLEYRFGSAKNFETHYNEISKRDNRLNPNQANNIKAVIGRLENENAKKIASDELRMIQSRNGIQFDNPIT